MHDGNPILAGEDPKWADLAVCAYCGHEAQDDRDGKDEWERDEDDQCGVYDGMTHVYWCPSCKAMNEVRRRVQFVTRRVEDLPWLKDASRGDSNA